jgi:hypothetical protein
MTTLMNAQLSSAEVRRLVDASIRPLIGRRVH